MPLVAPTGVLIAMKGSSVREEIVEHRDALERWGCDEPAVLVLGEDVVDPPTIALRVAWADPGQVRLDVDSAKGGRSGSRSSAKKRGKQGSKNRTSRGRKG